MLEGEFQSESLDGHLPVLGLGSTLRGLRTDARRSMPENDGSLRLVSMLAAGT
jgi:hypothetical protein